MRWLEAHRYFGNPAAPSAEGSLEHFLPIELGDLRLRRVRPEDFDDLVEFLTDAETMQYHLGGAYAEEGVAALIEGQGSIEVGAAVSPLVGAIELLPEAKVVGECVLVMPEPNDRQAYVGITLHPTYMGRGLATRALATLVGFAIVRLGTHRVVAAADVRNERAHRLVERIGMRREGHHLHAVHTERGWVDLYTYAMLEEEWLARHPEIARRLGEPASPRPDSSGTA